MQHKYFARGHNLPDFSRATVRRPPPNPNSVLPPDVDTYIGFGTVPTPSSEKKLTCPCTTLQYISHEVLGIPHSSPPDCCRGSAFFLYRPFFSDLDLETWLLEVILRCPHWEIFHDRTTARSCLATRSAINGEHTLCSGLPNPAVHDDGARFVAV